MPKPKRATRGRTRASAESRARQTSQSGIVRHEQGERGELAFLSKASNLGFVLSLPYGQRRRYDFVVDGGGSLWRVQVKTTVRMARGMYQVGIHRRSNGKGRAYVESEIDFVAVYVLPEDTWSILPVREVVGRTAMLFRPKGCCRLDPYAHYREAWHLLREPDGLVFG